MSVTLYLLQTYSSGKPLFKGQGPVNLTMGGMFSPSCCPDGGRCVSGIGGGGGEVSAL